MAIVKRDGVDLYYQLCGQGPPVLFIQGVGVIGAGWQSQISELGKSFQTLCYDNRGLGQSVPCRGPINIEAMAADARALLDEASWESAHVIGHSMGGVIAQQLALDAPQRVQSLSLLCTFARGRDAARVTPWVLWMTLRTRLGTRRMRRRAFLEMLWPPDALPTMDTDQLATEVAALLGRDLADQPTIMAHQVHALARHDMLSRLGELAHIPTLVLSGHHDPIALPAYGRKLAAAIPGAKFEELMTAAHGAIIQQPEIVNDRLARFLSSVENKKPARML